MRGYEGGESSNPKWTTNFKDSQIFEYNLNAPWIYQSYAGWGVDVNISHKDSGIKVINLK